MATWSYLIYEIIGSAGCMGFLGYLISDMLQMQFQVNIPWWSFALATTVLIWALTHHGIQMSARITALLGVLELLIMLALSITFLIHPRTGSTYLAPLKPSSSPHHHFGGILAGMVFSILALSGFEVGVVPGGAKMAPISARRSLGCVLSQWRGSWPCSNQHAHAGVSIEYCPGIAFCYYFGLAAGIHAAGAQRVQVVSQRGGGKTSLRCRS